MFPFIILDGTVVLAFVLLGVIVAGASVKELADFLVEKVHLVYPAFMAVLIVCLAIYYIGHKICARNESGVSKDESDRIAFNRVICFAINSPFAVFCPIAMIRTLAYFISTMGFGGFIIALMMFFILGLLALLCFWIFIKAWEMAEEKNYSGLHMTLVSFLLLIPQWLIFEIINGFAN